ncbi:hypothetical protein [Marivivens marinus]|uniref:hypothetical protein n=1 Tax=Marivivens marinus TaxID=3110173 RepID=UPI003B845B26
MNMTNPPVFQTKNDLESVLVAVNDSLPLRKIEAMLERTDLSADAKSIALEVASQTIVVAGQIVQIGRKIVSFALELARTIPNTLFGVALALVITALVAGIPVVGALLAGLLKSILLIFGIAQGALADMRSGELGARLENLIAQLMPLKDLSA